MQANVHARVLGAGILLSNIFLWLSPLPFYWPIKSPLDSGSLKQCPLSSALIKVGFTSVARKHQKLGGAH